MNPDIERILYTEEQIADKVKKIAKQIDDEYAGKNPLILCILKGSLIFTADLLRALEIPADVEFIQISSYGCSACPGELIVKKDVDVAIADRHVIVVEDILDTGTTLSYIVNLLHQRNPASVKICAMFSKPSRRRESIQADFIGYDVPDEFVVGYGLDYAESYRGLPYLGVLKRSVYKHASE